MSAPFLVNAGSNHSTHPNEDDLFSTSIDRQSSIARLGTSPAPSGRSFDDLSERQVALAVKRHLVETSPAVSLYDEPRTVSSTSTPPEREEEIRSVHQLQGGAIAHDVYKWTESQLNQTRRSQSVIFDRPESGTHRLKDPGGFRRHFMLNKAGRADQSPPEWMTNSFVSFLALYGHFGGEDLSDDEDEVIIPSTLRHRRPQHGYRGLHDERTPLIPPTESSSHGKASSTKAVFLLLKSFIGTGVMFLPKAFHNGGFAFSTILLSVIAVISLYSFLLLVETRNRVPTSFGDMGGILFGPTMRALVLFSITVSQIGFVCAYMVFVAQNAAALVETVSECQTKVSTSLLIIAQIAIFVPLAMIRKIQKLSVFALIADAFILLGLAYLYYYDFITLARYGVGDVIWAINPASFAMFIGTAVFTFEGVGLIIPITESMKDPKQFPRVLSYTMLFITLLFLSIGAVSYLAFGSDVQTVILLNLPDTPVVNTIQGLYALAICLSIPLQLFPAIRIVETGLFTRSGKHNVRVKWQKNLLRLGTVMGCAAVAIAGSADLDKFVSLIGSVCCIPLCFLFPPLFHLKAVAHTRTQKALDIVIIFFGILSMLYTTYITLSLWTGEGGEAPPPISRCPQ